MSWPLILAIGAVMVLLGAIVAVGARSRPEDAGIPDKARRQDDGGGAVSDGGLGYAPGDCGGGDGGGGD